jgi:beta-glucosidase
LNANSILTVGQMAEYPSIGGGGSSYIEPLIPIKSLKEELEEVMLNSKIEHCAGYIMNGANVCAFGTRICMLEASKNDVSIVVVGNNQHIELESVDRENISLHKEYVDLINNVAKVSKKTVVVIMAGSCIDVSSFEGNVNAIVYAGFGGNGVLKGLANLLSGRSNFSGKLSETFVNRLEDISTFNYRGDSFSEVYNDRVFVGYRYYDSIILMLDIHLGMV